MNFSDSLFKMASSLALVIALLLLAAAVGRRWFGATLATAGPLRTLRVAGSLSLGSRRSVMLVEVGDRTLVVGATPQNLVLLTEFDDRSRTDAPVSLPSAHTSDMPEQFQEGCIVGGTRARS